MCKTDGFCSIETFTALQKVSSKLSYTLIEILKQVLS